MRLQSFLSKAGIASRRKVVDLIKAGKATVNGIKIFEPGHAVEPARDQICFEGKRVAESEKLYFAFHKPRGVITTTVDTHGRKTVLHFFKSLGTHLYPVGRLDQETTGLLLMTNDGDLANHVMHPRHGCTKLYEVVLRDALSPVSLKKAERGLRIESGKTSPCQIRFVAQRRENYLYHIWLQEGMNRQIRQMMIVLGAKLLSLHRIAVGPVKLGGLKPGAFRPLQESELKKLKGM